MGMDRVGISGMAAYLPPLQVDLEQWCQWRGDSWDKVGAVIGRAFRMPAPDENAYTMAATAVLRLIERYDIDPSRVGYLALGTESSTDNSAGAVLVRGMLDKALLEQGQVPLSRACEVPEFKHACLGGVYALKAALRYLRCDGQGKAAIVVCADVAEYARQTSGEPTQGAGAVAMLLEASPTLLSVDLELAGSSSAYRGPDFRKPLSRFVGQQPSRFAQPRDFPVVNGKYSTSCYLEAALSAGRDLYQRLQQQDDRRAPQWLRDQAMIYLHRPYQRMAENGLAYLYLLALSSGDRADREELHALAGAAAVDPQTLRAELDQHTDLGALLADGNLALDPFPATAAVARHLRKEPVFARLTTREGTGAMQRIGNLYTASLPAWMAAGIEDAWRAGRDLSGRSLLAAGYGSGDAAELLVMRFEPGWAKAAARLDFAGAMASPRTLDQSEYEALHEGASERTERRAGTFYIDHVGTGDSPFDDTGIEYYSYHR